MADAATSARDVIKTILPAAKRLSLVLGRFIRIMGTIGVFAALGYWLGRLILETGDAKTFIEGHFGTTSGVLLIIVGIKEGLPLLHDLVVYVKTGQGKGLYTFSSFIFLTFLGMVVVTNNVFDAKPTPLPTPHVVFVQAPTASESTQDGDEKDLDLAKAVFAIPFFSEASGCDRNLGKCSRGLEIDPGTKGFIERVTAGLLHCATEQSSVELEIRGFASSSPFPGNSEELNLWLANQRAKVIEAYIHSVEDRVRDCEIEQGKRWRPGEMQKGVWRDGQCTDSEDDARENAGLTAVARIWEDFQEMEAARNFSDRDSDGNYDELAGVLNRRAEIHVITMGRCDLQQGSG